MTFVQVIDDSFTHADTSVGSGANSITGVPTPSAGNEWQDVVGNQFHISSNTVIYAGTTYQSQWLLRPAAENHTSVKIVTTIKAGSGGQALILLRATPGGVGNVSGNCYCLLLNGSNLTLCWIANGTLHTIANDTTASIVSGSIYILTFSAVTNVSGGTDLLGDVATAAAPGVSIVSGGVLTRTGNTDGPQGAGQSGLAALGTVYTHVTTYSADVAAGIAVPFWLIDPAQSGGTFSAGL